MDFPLKLFDDTEYLIDDKGRRNRPPVPSYIKFYSVFKYDRDKFRVMLNEWLLTDEGKNRTLYDLKLKQDEILDKCYERDLDGKVKRDSDEKHIYRIKLLHNIYERVYEYVIMTYRFNTLLVQGIKVNYEDRQAELNNTWQLSIYGRIVIHIRLIRLLKAGYTPIDAVNALKNGEYKQFRELQREQINRELYRRKGLYD